jgi:L-amino acid N-acyltransferase YncA
VTIRPAEPADAAAVAAIYAHYVATSPATFDEEAPAPKAIAATIESARLPFLVAETDGEVSGYAYLGPYKERSAYRFTAECSVYVAHDARGRGIGRALLERLLAEGERAGIRQVIAIIGATGGEASIALHRRFGFRHVGRLEAVGFKHDRWHDTVLMQRSLSPGE